MPFQIYTYACGHADIIDAHNSGTLTYSVSSHRQSREILIQKGGDVDIAVNIQAEKCHVCGEVDRGGKGGRSEGRNQ
jgi:hypothetical protein